MGNFASAATGPGLHDLAVRSAVLLEEISHERGLGGLPIVEIKVAAYDTQGDAFLGEVIENGSHVKDGVIELIGAVYDEHVLKLGLIGRSAAGLSGNDD